jgi:5-methylcytosine-specific restriction endonuclease McrA
MRKSKYTKELLEPIVKASTSVSGVLTALGLKPTGGNYRNIQAKIKYLGISTDHFTGQGWSKGKTGLDKKNTFTDAEVFVNPSPMTSGQKLKSRMLRNGWEYKCAVCDINTWYGAELTLHIDHIDGNHTNNEKSNLRFLCPNCHQMTDTWGNKSKLSIHSEIGKEVWIDVQYTLRLAALNNEFSIPRSEIIPFIANADDATKQELIESLGLGIKRINGKLWITSNGKPYYDVYTGEEYTS